MPGKESKGDLIITFDIEFPTYLPENTKLELLEALA